jgi:hypothetical protein
MMRDLVLPFQHDGQFADVSHAQIARRVNLSQSKYIPKIIITVMFRASRPHEGRFAIVTIRGAGCDGRKGAQTMRTGAYGQAVWSWHLDAGVKLRKAICAATVAKEPEHRGERGVSRKAIAQGVPVVSAHLY